MRSEEYYNGWEAEMESGHCSNRNTKGNWFVGGKPLWVDMLKQKAIDEAGETNCH